MHPWPR